jgi:hypothetical protein
LWYLFKLEKSSGTGHIFKNFNSAESGTGRKVNSFLLGGGSAGPMNSLHDENPEILIRRSIESIFIHLHSSGGQANAVRFPRKACGALAPEHGAGSKK